MFFDRHDGGERAVLVYVELISDKTLSLPEEFRELARSTGAEIVEFISATKVAPHAQTLIRPGKLADLKSAVELHEADVVIFSRSLSPSQQRNLEGHCDCRVIDRTNMILDIFAQRARTHAGKLQVELAQLDYVATRLIRGWTHLERQKGGIGLRGPGETQLETDRRLIRHRIKTLEGRLHKVHQQRALGRRARKRSTVPTVSLVGYTNAGKSTLFNQLSDAGVYAADQLFATLDPTLRRIDIQDVGAVVIADTVGFIRDLPHKLVDAFRGTLEEVIEADLLLHIIDAADAYRNETCAAVNEVLSEIGAGEVPCLLVYNKIDLLGSTHSPRIERDDSGQPVSVWLSAHRGEGLELLQLAISERLGKDMIHASLSLGNEDGRLRALLFEHKSVVNEVYDDAGQCVLEIRAPQAELRRLLKEAKMGWDQLVVLSGADDVSEADDFL